MQPVKLVLASSSPRRRELLSSLGVDYEVITPDIDETQHPAEPPLAYVQRLALAKAQAIAQRLHDARAVLAADTVVILAADTIGVDDAGVVLGKPNDAADARATLRALRGREHRVCTAFALLRTDDPAAACVEVVTTWVRMRSYSDAEIDAYIATGDPFDKAGSYAIQHQGFRPVASLRGSPSNVVGLPVDEVHAALVRLGVIHAAHH